MQTNEAGIKVYEMGDVVRVGKGKVEWTVGVVHNDEIQVQSDKGQTRYVSAGDLTLIRRVELRGGHGPELEIPTEETSDGDKAVRFAFSHLKPVQEPTSYAKSILHGLQFKAHVYAGTVTDKVKAKRRAKGKVQKASRKANR